MSFLSKKGLATLLIVGIVVPASIVVVPRQAKAVIPPAPSIQVPVADTFNFPFHFFEANKEAVFDGILFAAMKSIINEITSNILDWINTGFDGKPAFVVNETEFISRVSTQIFGDVYSEALTKYGSAPFVGVLAQSLVTEYTESYSDKKYTLAEDIGGADEVDAFLDGDFSKGGWSGWYSLTQKPENNIFGARQQTKQAYQERAAAAQDLITNDLTRNSGFFSQRDISGNIVTPGSVIESQLENVLGSGVRQLELADEFNELIGALIGTLTNKVFSSSGLSGTVSNIPGESSLIQQLLDAQAEEIQNPNDVLDYTVPSTGVPVVNPGDTGSGSGDQVGVYCFEFNVLGETSKDRECYSGLSACQQDREVFSKDPDLKVGLCQKL